MTKSIRVRVRVSGRVQGVCFRMETCEEAKGHGLKGWVRNLPTGDVEALFEGPESKVLEMVDWCHRGPPAARVTEVKVQVETFKGDLQDFKITY